MTGNERCSFCGRPATRLCERPVGRGHHVGHPPRSVMLHTAPDEKVPMSWTFTCDAPLCERCAVSLGSGIDFCPACVRRMKSLPSHSFSPRLWRD